MNKFMKWLDIETLEELREWAEGNGRHGDLVLMDRFKEEVTRYCRRKQGTYRWSTTRATEHMRRDIKDHFSPCTEHFWDYGQRRLGTHTYKPRRDR